MSARGFVQVFFEPNIEILQITKLLEIKGFKKAECADKSILTYKDRYSFDGEIFCSLESVDNDKRVLKIYPSGHSFVNQSIFIQQLCLDIKYVLNGETSGYINDVSQNSIENIKGESQAEVFFHNSYSKFINQSVLIDVLLRDVHEQRTPNFTKDKLISLIEVNIVTNMEIFFKELWKYILLDSKFIPKSLYNKRLDRYQIENLINGENDIEGILANNFSFQNMDNVIRNLSEISNNEFRIKDILGKLSKKYGKNFYNNTSFLFTSRHKIVHENEDLSYNPSELKESFYDVIRLVCEIYLSFCRKREYQPIMLHESIMSFQFLEELVE
ncbi:hypothetical protein [Enterococcus sp. AZ109]|uniref:hypothetical protein n=1 Tax=Enterococcus sp. AZ109 TaxID=2774634 RepID=UPI003F1FFD2B